MKNVKEKIINYKVLHVDGQTVYASRGYSIYKSVDGGNRWKLDGKLADTKYSLLSHIRLVARLLRIEVSSMQILDDGSRLLIAKKGIFKAIPNSKKYVRVFQVPRGSKPMNICIDSRGDLFFGEYLLNGPFLQDSREEVNMYTSKDRGESWDVCYTFSPNTIRHVHGVFYDNYTDKIWFTTGDRGNECIIGNSDDGFKTINIVKQGGQRYRAVKLLFYKDFIVYGTDTQIEQNYIYSLDRDSGDETELKKIQGSVISAAKVDQKACISTAVEPSEYNIDTNVYLWYTENGKEWQQLYSTKHDGLSLKYFQFARYQFPEGAIQDNKIFAYGSALKKIDGKSISLTVSK